MDSTIRVRLQAIVATVAGIVLLGGCVTTYQPRYGHDGIYYDDRHEVAVRGAYARPDPYLYPYWSLDYFYFSRFSGSSALGFGFGSGAYRHGPWWYDPWYYDPWWGPRWSYWSPWHPWHHWSYWHGWHSPPVIFVRHVPHRTVDPRLRHLQGGHIGQPGQTTLTGVARSQQSVAPRPDHRGPVRGLRQPGPAVGPSTPTRDTSSPTLRGTIQRGQDSAPASRPATRPATRPSSPPPSRPARTPRRDDGSEQRDRQQQLQFDLQSSRHVDQRPRGDAGTPASSRPALRGIDTRSITGSGSPARPAMSAPARSPAPGMQSSNPPIRRAEPAAVRPAAPAAPRSPLQRAVAPAPPAAAPAARAPAAAPRPASQPEPARVDRGGRQRRD